MHYSQPRHQSLAKSHYLYTVEIPSLTDDNHIVSAKPVPASIVQRVEAKLGKPIPQEKILQCKEFRKWLGLTLTGGKTVDVESERAAAEFLDGLGVFCNVWPQAQSKPDGLNNCAVFNAANAHIVKRERIEVEPKGKINESIRRDSTRPRSAILLWTSSFGCWHKKLGMSRCGVPDFFMFQTVGFSFGF